MAVQEYLGAIKLFAGSFAIKGYAFAQGQILAINQNTALFSLLGTNYGGNGVSTFQLPNLQSSLPISWGNGSGLTPRVIGETGGVENVSLLTSTVPPHTHVFNAAGAINQTSTKTAGPTVLLGPVGAGSADTFYVPPNAAGFEKQLLNQGAVGTQGGNLPHNNIQPSMGINYIIALSGIFPSRS
jgi:microcystin-dependent protein